MEENKPQTDNTNPAPEPTPAPAASAPADGAQMSGAAPAGMPASKSNMGGKMGWVVAIVILLLLVLGGLWWWMMYGQPTSTTDTTTTPNSSNNSSNGSNGSNGSSGSNGSNSTTTTKPIDSIATVKVGDTMTTVEGKAGSLSPLCVDASGLEGGNAQKVCTYVDGTKSVKVTYQDSKVVEVTKLGF